jgi:putative phosphoesterase
MSSKILVISDSHGSRDIVSRIITHEKSLDFIVHCGDGAGDLFFAEIPEEVKIIKVTGNIDLYRNFDMERIEVFSADSFRIMVVHGDQFRVHDNHTGLIQEAERRGVDLVFFGHTHKKHLSGNRPVIFNPGPANRGMYGIVTLGEKVEFSHRVIT